MIYSEYLKEKFIKSWQNISQEICQLQTNLNVSKRITNIRKKIDNNPEMISHLKLKI